MWGMLQAKCPQALILKIKTLYKPVAVASVHFYFAHSLSLFCCLQESKFWRLFPHETLLHMGPSVPPSHWHNIPLLLRDPQTLADMPLPGFCCLIKKIWFHLTPHKARACQRRTTKACKALPADHFWASPAILWDRGEHSLCLWTAEISKLFLWPHTEHGSAPPSAGTVWGEPAGLDLTDLNLSRYGCGCAGWLQTLPCHY